jgi:ribosome-associated protein
MSYIIVEPRPGLVVPECELEESYSRSGGAGGMNVNKVNSKVTLRWDLRGSAVLSPETLALLEERLASRLTLDGVLVLQSSESRSQRHNRQAARLRLLSILRSALKSRRARRATKPSRGAKQRRLDTKRRRGTLKSGRRGQWLGE